MIKFKITGERIAEACNIAEYILLSSKHRDTILRVAPRFVLDKNGEYIIKVNLDEEGDIEGFDNTADAFAAIAGVTPKRLGKLIDEFARAAGEIVNPPSDGA